MKISYLLQRAALLLLVIVSITFGQDAPPTTANCNPSHDHLDPSSHRFISPCPDEMYCSPIQNQINTNHSTNFLKEQSDNFVKNHSQDQDLKQHPILDHDNQDAGEKGHNSGGVCVPRTCRRDEYPFGFPSNSTLPPLCFFPSLLPSTTTTRYFCPDNGSGCRAVLPPGSTCELARDEQCATEPIRQFDEGMSKGALCLNRVCTYVNATLANPCLIENTTYTLPSANSHSLYSIPVIRHNCITGFYCEPESLTCGRAKAIGQPCNADFECITRTCDQDTCINSFSYEIAPRKWAILISVILIALIATMVTLILIHRHHRYLRFRELREYYLEQISLRKAIITLHSAGDTDGYLLNGGSNSVSVQ